MRRIRLRFWLLVLDAICLVPGGFGSRAYHWALTHASNATNWGKVEQPWEPWDREPF